MVRTIVQSFYPKETVTVLVDVHCDVFDDVVLSCAVQLAEVLLWTFCVRRCTF